jgi:hypothetical protein
MDHSDKVSVRLTLACAVCVMSACLSPAVLAQKGADSDIPEMKVTQVDLDAAHEAGTGRVHGFAANVPGAKEKLAAVQRERNASSPKPRVDAVANSASADAFTGPYFYPGDLSSGGGPTLETTRLHAIYVNAPGSIASTWGNPEGFLRDLNESSFIQITDQYTGAGGDGHYPVGSHARVRYGTPGVTLYESDIAAIVHAVASEHGAGGGNVYHVFLPPGTDTCFAPPSAQFPVPSCYSPDNPATFAFCGYHDAVQFSDIGIALFTVEPWLGPGSGCEIASPAPNGVLIDSTNNVLSHETFETITDPLPGLGFSNNTDGELTGAEIGDECVLFNFSPSPGSYIPPTFLVNGKKYAVQPEYSNTYHACVTQP